MSGKDTIQEELKQTAEAEAGAPTVEEDYARQISSRNEKSHRVFSPLC